MIELKHLATYLPYRINVQIERLKYPIGKEIVELSLKNIDQFDNKKMWKFKPILRPMSDLCPDHPAMLEIQGHHTVDFNIGNTFVEIENECNSDPYSVEWLPYKCFEILLKHHIDVLNLIGQGLAISIHDLEK